MGSFCKLFLSSAFLSILAAFRAPFLCVLGDLPGVTGLAFLTLEDRGLGHSFSISSIRQEFKFGNDDDWKFSVDLISDKRLFFKHTDVDLFLFPDNTVLGEVDSPSKRCFTLSSDKGTIVVLMVVSPDAPPVARLNKCRELAGDATASYALAESETKTIKCDMQFR